MGIERFPAVDKTFVIFVIETPIGLQYGPKCLICHYFVIGAPNMAQYFESRGGLYGPLPFTVPL